MRLKFVGVTNAQVKAFLARSPKASAFDSADYYSVDRDAREDPRVGTVKDAILEWQSDLPAWEDELRARNRGYPDKVPPGGVRVFAFKHNHPKIPAGGVLDHIVKHLTERCCAIDHSCRIDRLDFTGDPRVRAEEILQHAIDSVIASVGPWQAFTVGWRIYTAEQIAAIVSTEAHKR